MPPTRPPKNSWGLFSDQLKRDRVNLVRWVKTGGQFRSDIARLRGVRGIGIGKKILLVANGPSAATLPPNFVRDFRASGGAVMAMNWAHLNPAVSSEPIDYYVSADRRMVADGEESLALRKFLRLNRQALGFVPEIRVAEWRRKVPDSTFLPFCRIYVRHLRLPHWRDSPIYPKRFFAHTGLHALQLARWLGFERVFLIGFDNSYISQFRPGKNGLKTQLVSYAGDSEKAAEITEDTVSFLVRQTRLFRDYWNFSDHKTQNLDPASLTDCFEVSSPAEAIGYRSQPF